MPVKLESLIFDKVKRRAVISSAVSKSAKVFKEATRRRMVESKPSGRIEERGRAGKGFSRRFRRSARGQRPAVDTGTLINALSDKKTGEFSSEVFIADKTNPRNKANAKDYGERLQTKMSRHITDGSGDQRIAELEFKNRCEKVVDELAK